MVGISLISFTCQINNYFIKSGAAEDHIEVHCGGIPQENVAQYMNQLYDISKEQSIPLHEVPDYMEKKLDEKLRMIYCRLRMRLLRLLMNTSIHMEYIDSS